MMKWSEDWDRRSSSLNCRTLPEAVAATIPARLKSQCEAKDWDFVVIFSLWIFQKEAKRSAWPVGASNFQHFTSPKRNLRSSPPHLLLKYYPNPYLGPKSYFRGKTGCSFFPLFVHFWFLVATKVGASEARFAPIDLVTQSVCLFRMGEKNLPKMNECPLERDHVKKEMVSSSVSGNFQGRFGYASFFGGVWYEKENMFCPKWDEKKQAKTSFSNQLYIPICNVKKKGGWVVLVNYFK